ncbi:hypothetical protein V5N11_032745 [Cardamine amara subsp. amara]|uniref:Uncharacterized protein n=1 Tax=Cardamine amara subsp. amara TaxID=228776 RepID=A0ABD1AK80_CARAN
MAKNVGSDESEIESITTSQKSFLKNCPFADPGAPPTDSDCTEVLGYPISPAFVRTPILSFSSPTSLDSINDEVFRTPPENAYISSDADSEPRVRVSELKPQEGSNLKTPSSKSKTTPFSENVRVLETNHRSVSRVVVPPSSPPSVVSDYARVSGKHRDFDSPSPTAIKRIIVLENQQISDSVANSGLSKTRVLVPLSSPPSVAADVVRVPAKQSETEDSGGVLPFKEIIEALLRNSGENLNERDENFSYVDILKQCGFKFP